MRIATVQSIITPDIRTNGAHIRTLMEQARDAGARLAHFPEGALSGYVKAQIAYWDDVDWPLLDAELQAIAACAQRLGLWVVVGCNHRLASPLRPQNSLHVISDAGALVARYSKRFCSQTEVVDWYTPGMSPVVFVVDGIRLGCALCIEVCFPEVFAEYERLRADCVLLSSYSADPVHGLMARAHAATTCCWTSLATPVACSPTLPAQLIGPDGAPAMSCPPGQAAFVHAVIDPQDPTYEIPIRRARPWRARARAGNIYAGRQP